jgi:tetraprenyl-beta-curcumene synthase
MPGGGKDEPLMSVLSRAKDRAVIVPYVFRVFPAVEWQLDTWRAKAATIPDPELRRQAQASLEKKRFHCQGGSIYSLLMPAHASAMIRFIVALQTISDYLDNLCDRVPEADGTSYRTLHQAMTAALERDAPAADWYADYPHGDDGGYLDALVEASGRAVSSLAGYGDVRNEMQRLAGLYSDLQVYKHVEGKQRVEMLVNWADRHRELAPGIYWWEFAAASGSTLAVFALAALASAGPVPPPQAQRLLDAYFPWLCGLHILLDYFIDMDEDREHGDLNFAACYPGSMPMEEGLIRFLRCSLEKVEQLPRPAFHRTVVLGLLALYLSDPKASQGGRIKISQQLLRYGGPEAQWLQKVCVTLRNRGLI